MTRKILRSILVLISVSLILNFLDCCFAQNATDNMPVATMPDVPKNLPVLALSRNNLNTVTTKVGDVFSAKLVENLTVDSNVLIPKDSTVYGVVTKIRKPQRYPLRNGFIDIAVNQIESPQGQRISLERREILAKVISPMERTIKSRTVRSIPPRAAGYGTSIPLGQGTDLSGGAVYAISMGASVVAGAATGLIVPDYGKSRINSSLNRAVDATPIGVVRGFVAKGADVGLKVGDGIIINFDKRALQEIRNQKMAQTPLSTGVAQR